MNAYKCVCSNPIATVLILTLALLLGSGCPWAQKQLTTRERTVHPVAIPAGTPGIPPSYVPEYEFYGYSAWDFGPGEDEGRKFDLMQANYTGARNRAQLLSFFAMSDIHITDKESPAEVLYYGWSQPSGASGLLSQAYSPVVLSTTHVLEATVETINALDRRAHFDFGIALGDMANSSQTNELRWFIDIMDGKYITPSSGANLGANVIEYQKPYQAVGLNPTIPWYAVAGNHDQFFMGVAYPTDKVRDAEVGNKVLNMGPNPFAPNATEDTGVYVGVVDGTTLYGDVIKGGPEGNFATPPTVVADKNRLSMTTADSSTRNLMDEFFTTTSLPVGHGFTQKNLVEDSACYSFEPVANMPIKVIVLDDTCKTTSESGDPSYYGSGWIDEARYNWLTKELQAGQDAGQLMIVATHIPVNPQAGLTDTASAPQFYKDSYQNDSQLVATLQKYPNLILLIAGHRHLNTVTPQPSPDPEHPEYGFWEVENPSLRDFPQQFRTFDIRRNSDNTISILTTDVDPIIEPGSPAADSRGYAVGAARLFSQLTSTDTASHVYNAELVKQLTLEMQTKIANYGTPIGIGQTPRTR